MYKVKGFTLIELMVVVVIITILALIALPSYKNYIRRADLSQAQQDMQKIADQLERYKGRNFSYNGFKLASSFEDVSTASIVEESGVMYLPMGSTALNAKYVLTLKDADKDTILSAAKIAATETTKLGDGLGHTWKMKAISADVANFSIVMNSEGLQCKTTNQIDAEAYRCVAADATGMGDAW